MQSLLTKIRLFAKRLVRLPGLRRPVARIWNTYEHVVFYYHAQRNLREGNQVSEIDPFRTFWVSPNDIKASSGGSFDFIVDTAKVVGGSWDLDHGSRITGSRRYKWFEQRFNNGYEWEETDYYARKIKKINEGRSKRYATVNEFKEKLNTYDRIYHEFERGNYLLQSELTEKRRVGSPGDGGRALFSSLTDKTLMRHEIAVNIGRDGCLFRLDGRHRMCLALIADLEEIPVRVVVRHAKWQALRDKVAITIDDALENDVPADVVYEHVQETLADELEGVFLGLDHPDLNILFQRRL